MRVDARPPYDRYLLASYHGLECLRQSSGLIADTASVTAESPNKKLPECPVQIVTEPTSPTNIALDLLVQREMIQYADANLKKLAAHNIDLILGALQHLDYHHDSGLFFNQYDPTNLSVSNFYVSSIDNLHLAYALWVLSVTYEEASYKEKAKNLFQRMHFSVFYDPHDGLMRGGLRDTTSGAWVPEVWKYQYFGSESRSLYSLGWVLGLIDDPKFLDKAFQAFEQEVFLWKDSTENRRMLALWDGGAFQLLLPSLLVQERTLSKQLKEMFGNYADFVLSEEQRLNYPVPAAFSACRFADYYNGEAGSPFLVSHLNKEITVPALKDSWDQVYTPHAAFLAATSKPDVFAEKFIKAENLISPQGKLYRDAVGWMDGLYVKGEQVGQVVPDVLSLDQTMSALAILQILSPDGLLTGQRALASDPNTNKRMVDYYERVDHMLSLIPAGLVLKGTIAPWQSRTSGRRFR